MDAVPCQTHERSDADVRRQHVSSIQRDGFVFAHGTPPDVTAYIVAAANGDHVTAGGTRMSAAALIHDEGYMVESDSE